MGVHPAVTWLFVPGSRHDRFDKAAASGADEVVVDLEDAVAAGAKTRSRAEVATWLDSTGAAWVRVNAAGTEWHEADLAALGDRPGLRGVVVPKAESPETLQGIRDRLPGAVHVMALVETARGVDQARSIATRGAVDRLAFGSIDFALDIGAEENDTALLFARSALVLASRVGDLPAPVDGVTVATGDGGAAREAAVRARDLGFGGKLCLHPRQVAPVAEGFRPSADQRAWAARVLRAARERSTGGEDPGAFGLDGTMVDLPVLERARAIAARGGVTT